MSKKQKKKKHPIQPFLFIQDVTEHDKCTFGTKDLKENPTVLQDFPGPGKYRTTKNTFLRRN